MTNLSFLIDCIKLIDQAEDFEQLNKIEISLPNLNQTLSKILRIVVYFKKNQIKQAIDKELKDKKTALKIAFIEQKRIKKTRKERVKIKKELEIIQAPILKTSYISSVCYKSYFRKNISVIKAKINEVDLTTLSKIIEIPEPFFSQLVDDVFFKTKNVYKMKIEPAPWFHEAKRVNNG
jgi:hypothetical protein